MVEFHLFPFQSLHPFHADGLATRPLGLPESEASLEVQHQMPDLQANR